jgi:hypothetical protein
MRRAVIVLFCLVAVAVSSPAALDLTPVLKESTSEGITVKQLVFNDGPRQVTYDLPSQWTYRAAGDSIKLAPPNASDADVGISTIPLAGTQAFDDQGMAAAREHFMQGIPATVRSPKIVAEQLNAVPVKGGNFEITASYQALGKTFTRRALYINLPDTQLIFRLTAREDEFENLWRTLRRSILSWQWVEGTPAATAVATR